MEDSRETPPTALDMLATYNAERARGLVHTREWEDRMAVLQERFDADLKAEAQRETEAYISRSLRRINLKQRLGLYRDTP